MGLSKKDIERAVAQAAERLEFTDEEWESLNRIENIDEYQEMLSYHVEISLKSSLHDIIQLLHLGGNPIMETCDRKYCTRRQTAADFKKCNKCGKSIANSITI